MKIIKYNASLVAVATATYQLLGGWTAADSIALDGSGNVYMEVSTAGVATALAGAATGVTGSLN